MIGAEISLSLIGSAIVLLLLSLGYWQWRKKYHQSIMNLGSPSKRQGSWWYKNRYTPSLPLASPYSGKLVQPKIFATEHLRDTSTNSTHALDEAFPYQRREKFFSPTELTLLQALEKVFQPYPYRVFSKVCLTELLDPSTELSSDERRIALERLRRERLDFVICHIGTGAIVGIITLDEESKREQLDLQLHERFVDIALLAVGIPSIHITAKPDYQTTVLRQTLQESLKLPLLVSVAKISTIIGTCPKCGQPLKRVKVTKGKLAGRQLRVCSHYPRCKTLLPENSV
ncbi:MAG: hypothetical protein BWK79_01720 [Beggiatoa sp. IS2]|nr:MAG: hypothetical protein BWK79_01720 [Beggiatoa sp. IS2]